MTSNTTLLNGSRLAVRGYIEHHPLKPITDGKRRLYVTQEISNLLNGKLMPGTFPSVAADAVITRFCRGHIVGVTRRQTVTKSDLKWLQGHDEAWVMAFKGPGTGWRMFGRFARKNQFVGLAAYERGELVPYKKYNEKAVEMVAEWEKCFPGVEPYRARNLEDYLGGMHRDDDEL